MLCISCKVVALSHGLAAKLVHCSPDLFSPKTLAASQRLPFTCKNCNNHLKESYHTPGAPKPRNGKHLVGKQLSYNFVC